MNAKQKKAALTYDKPFTNKDGFEDEKPTVITREEASRDAVINKLAASHQLFCPGCGKEMELRPRLIAKEAKKKKEEQ